MCLNPWLNTISPVCTMFFSSVSINIAHVHSVVRSVTQNQREHSKLKSYPLVTCLDRGVKKGGFVLYFVNTRWHCFLPPPPRENLKMKLSLINVREELVTCNFCYDYHPPKHFLWILTPECATKPWVCIPLSAALPPHFSTHQGSSETLLVEWFSSGFP